MALHVTTKMVTRKRKDGSTKRYKYYQLVKSYREGGKVKTKFVAYLGKSPRISRRRAEELGLSIEELSRVKGLRVGTVAIDVKEFLERLRQSPYETGTLADAAHVPGDAIQKMIALAEGPEELVKRIVELIGNGWIIAESKEPKS